MQLQISGDALAWYAAVTATASIAVSVYPLWRDRPRPVATAGRDMVIVGHGQDPDARYLVITVANRGVRPITISQVGLHDAEAKKVLLAYDLFTRGPREVTEGKSESFLFQQNDVNVSAVDKLFVRDASGQRWRAPFSVNSEMLLKRTKKVL